MKFFWIAASTILLQACKNSSPAINDSNEASDSGIYFSYTPLYTTEYKIGNYKNVKTVTDFWKQFENGDVMTTAPIFADSVSLVFHDTTLKGPKETVLARLKKMRDNYATVQSFLYSWLPAATKDRNEEWVFLWGRQDFTDKQKKIKSTEIHEEWRFDKNGKIFFMQQFEGMKR